MSPARKYWKWILVIVLIVPLAYYRSGRTVTDDTRHTHEVPDTRQKHQVSDTRQTLEVRDTQLTHQVSDTRQTHEVPDVVPEHRLPKAIIIGVAKAGTKALLEYLNVHPDVEAAYKEPAFFSHDKNYRRGMEWYRHRMPRSLPHQITIEKSPQYFMAPKAPERIREMNSTIRLILIVRQPLTRMVSRYVQKKVPETFETQVTRKDGSIKMAYYPLRASMYATNIQPWLRTFSRSQLHVVDGDKLVRDPMSELPAVEHFLGLGHKISADDFYLDKEKGFFCLRRNVTLETETGCLSKTKGRAHPEIDAKLARKLNQIFRPHNELFYKLVSRRFDWD